MTHNGYKSPFAFDMAVHEVVLQIQPRGFLIDKEVQAKFIDQARKDWVEYQRFLDFTAMKHVNVNSAPQMQQLFYGDYGLRKRTNTKIIKGVKKKVVTTDETALRSIMVECREKLAALKTKSAMERYALALTCAACVLRIRAVRKMLSSYLEIDIDSDGKIRSTLSVGGADNGRFTSSKTLWGTGCNLQTIPRKLRKMFIADEGWELAEFDLNRGESWIYSHLAEDFEMMDIHHSGRDFHAETGAAITSAFGLDPLSPDFISENEKTDDRCYFIRYMGKRVNHASAYKMGPGKQQEVVNEEADETGITISFGQSKEAQLLWKQKYPGMPMWWDRVEQKMNKDRILENCFGRRHVFHEFFGDSLFRKAVSWEPSSTSVDYMNLGMLRVFNALDRGTGDYIKLLHQNHDSIVVTYPIELRDEVVPQIIDLIEDDIVVNGYKIRVPVEGGYGHSWGELKKWKAA